MRLCGFGILFGLLFGCLFGEVSETTFLTDFEGADSASARGEQAESPPSASPLDSEPSTMIAGCVNAISGDFCETQTDIVVPGAQPIVIQRTYVSSSFGVGTHKECLKNRWSFNHEATLKKGWENKKDLVKTVESGGGAHRYTGLIANGGVLALDQAIIQSGLTNCGSGEISGRSNLKNSKVTFENNFYVITSGSGAKRYFIPETHPKQSAYRYLLNRDVSPNGNSYHYLYEKEKRLNQIQALNSDGQELAHVILNYPDKFKKDPCIALRAIDGRHVYYRFKSTSGKFILEDVDRPDSPPEHYEYADNFLLARIERPEGHYREVIYYGDTNEWNGEKIRLPAGYDMRRDRVWLLKAPVGVNGEPIVTHRFYYSEQKGQGGATGVYDALGHKTDYGYNAQRRLTHVVKYRGSDPYSIDRLFWGTDARDSSNLVSRVFEGERKNYFCRYFIYDENGNVVEERLLGNLTGRTDIPVMVNSNGIPQSNGCESSSKFYQYSRDGLNLLLSENDGRKQTIYGYNAQKKDLLESRLIKTSQGIVQRHFYDYDDNAVLIKEIVDDGCSEDRKSLTHVSERHITYTFPRKSMPVGLPEVIEERYLDLATGLENLIKRTVNTHSKEGRLLRQEIYDSQGQFAYALQWEYDSKGNVIRETNALGAVTERKYDANGNVIFEQGPRSDFHKEYLYDFANRLISTEEIHSSGLHLSTQNRYNVLSEREASIDIYGNETRYLYDDYGRLIETQSPPVPNAQGVMEQAIVKVQYDPLNHPIVATDANGHCTKMSYTIRGEPIKIQYPDGGIESREYTLDGLLESKTARNGLKTVYTYDELENVVRTDLYAPSGELLTTTSATYNAFHLLSETDPAGNITRYEYDGAGRQIAIRKGNHLTTHSYDALGRVACTRQYADETNYIAQFFIYDVLDQLLEERTEDSAGVLLKKVSYAYDSEGNRTEVKRYTESGISLSRTDYNAYHEPEVVTDAEGNVTRTIHHYNVYNEQQHVACQEIIDALGNSTFSLYNTCGKVAKIYRRNSLGEVTQSIQHYYDRAGNPISNVVTVFTPNAPNRLVSTSLSYDSSNRLTDIWEAVGTPEQMHTHIRYNSYGQKEEVLKPNGLTLTYTYDVFGRLARFYGSDNSVDYSYTYDPMQRPVAIKGLEGVTQRRYDDYNQVIEETLAHGLTLGYTYDALDRMTQVTLPDQSAIRYAYQGCFLSTIERLKQDGERYSHSYHYDLSGQRTHEEMMNSLGEITYRYDRLGRPVELKNPYLAVELSSYDAVGNLLKYSLKTTQGEEATSYAYDSLYQLKQEQGATHHTYTHDSLHNRIAKDGSPHTVNALNQLLSDGKSSFTYDASGNLLEQRQGEQIVQYGYDALDRLMSVTKGNQQTRYGYDSENRRLQKSSYERDGEVWKEVGAPIRYIYQKESEIGAYVGNQMDELRVLGHAKSDVGAAIALELNNQVYASIYDHRGNVICIVSEDGVVENYSYSAFGEEKTPKNPISPWRFSSKRVDEESGLVYFGARYYVPETGRWLTRDPLGHTAGPNLYAYVHNNPLMHVDPYGLWGESLKRGWDKLCRYFSSAKERVSSCFKKGVEHFKKKAGGLARAPGRFIEYVGQNFVPIPLARDLVEFIGHVVAGRGWKNYTPSYSRQHSYFDYVEGNRIEGRSFVLINGVWTSESEALLRAIDYSMRLGGLEVCYSYNAGNGMIYDGIDWFCQKIGIWTNSSVATMKCLNAQAERVGINGEVWVAAHSQGGQILEFLRPRLSPKVKRQMRVSTFGAPCVIPEGDFLETKVFISMNDPIPLLDPIGYAKACLGYLDHVIFLKSNGLPCLDHSWEGTYSKASHVLGSNYIRAATRH